MPATPRNSTQRDKDRARIRATKAGCHICGQPINYDLPHTDPKAFVVDHVIPLAKGGPDALANKKAAHRRQQPRLQQQEAGTHRRTNRQALRLTRIAQGEDTPKACLPDLRG